jgi:hypothetical protein
VAEYNKENNNSHDRPRKNKKHKKAIRIEYNTTSPVVLLNVLKKMKYNRIRMAKFTIRAR